jgi:hypothetical protein
MRISETLTVHTKADPPSHYRLTPFLRGRKPYTALVTLNGGPYALVNLQQVRKALDEVTIQDGFLLDRDPEGKVAKVPLRGYRNGHFGGQTLDFSLRKDGKIQVLAPCGEKRRFSVRTLDRALTRAGF